MIELRSVSLALRGFNLACFYASGVMAKTHTGLHEGVPYQVSGATFIFIETN